MTCPECQSPTEEQEYSATYASCDGEPEETYGIATYCTNKDCIHFTEPLEGDEDTYE